jgi:hypothetical protein
MDVFCDAWKSPLRQALPCRRTEPASQIRPALLSTQADIDACRHSAWGCVAFSAGASRGFDNTQARRCARIWTDSTIGRPLKNMVGQTMHSAYWPNHNPTGMGRASVRRRSNSVTAHQRTYVRAFQDEVTALQPISGPACAKAVESAQSEGRGKAGEGRKWCQRSLTVTV